MDRLGTAARRVWVLIAAVQGTMVMFTCVVSEGARVRAIRRGYCAVAVTVAPATGACARVRTEPTTAPPIENRSAWGSVEHAVPRTRQEMRSWKVDSSLTPQQ